MSWPYTACALTIWIHSDLVMLPGLLIRLWNTFIKLDSVIPSLAYWARVSMISWGWILSGAGPPPGGEPAGGEPGGGDPLGVAVPPWFVSTFLGMD